MTDIQLARELKTTTNSLRAWRAKFPTAPRERDVDLWRDFLSTRLIGPYGPRHNYRGHSADTRKMAPPGTITSTLPPQIAAIEEEIDFCTNYMQGVRYRRLKHFPAHNQEAAGKEFEKIQDALLALEPLAGIPPYSNE